MILNPYYILSKYIAVEFGVNKKTYGLTKLIFTLIFVGMMPDVLIAIIGLNFGIVIMIANILFVPFHFIMSEEFFRGHNINYDRE